MQPLLSDKFRGNERAKRPFGYYYLVGYWGQHVAIPQFRSWDKIMWDDRDNYTPRHLKEDDD